MSVTTEQGLSIREVAASGGNPLRLKRVHHVEFWVGNAKQAAFFYRKAFGFSQLAYSGLETGNRQFASYVLQSGQIRFVLSAPYGPTSEIAAHHLVHGDGVRVIALEVDDVAQAYAATLARGAVSAWAPRAEIDEWGELRTSAIRTWVSFHLKTSTPALLAAFVSAAPSNAG